MLELPPEVLEAATAAASAANEAERLREHAAALRETVIEMLMGGFQEFAATAEVRGPTDQVRELEATLEEAAVGRGDWIKIHVEATADAIIRMLRGRVS